LARKKIRDTIAEISDTVDQSGFEFGSGETGSSFDFQSLAEELRRASQAKSGTSGRPAAPKRERKRASSRTDGDSRERAGLAVEDDRAEALPSAYVSDVDVQERPRQAPEPNGSEPPELQAEQTVTPPPDRFHSPNSVDAIAAADAPPPAAEYDRTDMPERRPEDRNDIVAPAEEPTGAAVDMEPTLDEPGKRASWPSIEAIAARIPIVLKAASRQLAVLIVAPVLIAALGAYIVSALSPNIYGARSEIVFSLRDMGWSLADRFLATQLVIAESPSTIAPVAEQFSIPLKELEDDFTVDIVRSSGVMRLEYRHADETTAQNVIKAITDRYLVALREFEQVDGGSHRLLTPALLMEDPLAPRPFRAALIGALAGLAIAAAAVVFRTRLRTNP